MMDGIFGRLDNLERRHPARYAQVMAAAFPYPPAYAMDDEKCDWWYSQEARDFHESLSEKNVAHYK